MKRVAIVQSNYIPWKGYFDLIASVDEFILYDDMQYTRRDWRNRNQIKTPQGIQWLTVPVKVKGKYFQTIRDTEIDGVEWAAHHWRTLQQNYSRAPYFGDYEKELASLYLDNRYSHLSILNRALLEWALGKLEIKTSITASSEYALEGDRTEKLLNLCLQANATVYISGPSAKDYLDESCFSAKGIDVQWFTYPEYPEYPQQWGEFSHGVTILDLLFNCGPTSRDYAVANRS